MGWEAVDLELQKTKWVGPTNSKMFLVSTHFCLPRLQLLAEGIEVGIGAQEAFKILIPGIQKPKDFSMLPNRRSILTQLLAAFEDTLDAREPRLRPMIAWEVTRAATLLTPQGVPPQAFTDHLTVLDFQVGLCEWRKFRNNVDKKRAARRGIDLATRTTSKEKPSDGKKKRKRG